MKTFAAVAPLPGILAVRSDDMDESGLIKVRAYGHDLPDGELLALAGRTCEPFFGASTGLSGPTVRHCG